MNNRRLELEKTLPPPSKELCQFMWQYLSESGTHIQNHDILFISRIVGAYFKTENGLRSLLKLLNTEARPASILKTYFKSDRPQTDESRIKATDLQEFRGFIYKNLLAMDHTKIVDIDKEEVEICDACGGRFPADYCTKHVETFSNSGHSRIETRCNHCRYNSELPRVRETGSRQVCLTCEKTACDYHPRNERLMQPAQLALPPAQRIPDAWR